MKEEIIKDLEEALKLTLRCLAPASGEKEPTFKEKLEAVEKANSVLKRIENQK